MWQVGDVGCAVHLCTLLHQRYTEFSSLLLEQLQKLYSSGIKKEEDKVRGGVNGGRSGGPVGREGERKGELVIVGCEGERVVWRMGSVCVAGDELLLW